MARPTLARHTGTIRKLTGRGFGFVALPSGEDVFFHLSGLRPPLQWAQLTAGDTVSFVVQESPKGPRAEDVARDEV